MSSPSIPPVPAGRIAIAVQYPQIGHLLAMALRLNHYDPHLLPAGEPVLEALLREPYAAAIVDVHLRPVDGLTVCHRVRAATSMPVILLLMRDEVPERLRAREVGASALLFLPFLIDELLACVQGVLYSAEHGLSQRDPVAGDEASNGR
jgi:DNA-binding response OmpR family regulator